MTPATKPFYRRNAPIPLTRGDYAARAGVSDDFADTVITSLVRRGEIVRIDKGNDAKYGIYAIAPEPPPQPPAVVEVSPVRMVFSSDACTAIPMIQDVLRRMMIEDAKVMPGRRVSISTKGGRKHDQTRTQGTAGSPGPETPRTQA